MNALKRCEGWCVKCGLHQAAKTATASQTTDILFRKTIQLQGKPMMKAMWGQWIRQPISASVISNSFIGKLVCLEGLWWNWISWIHCAVEQFLGNSPNIKTKSFHTRKSPTVTSWGWRCCAKFLSHFSLFYVLEHYYFCPGWARKKVQARWQRGLLENLDCSSTKRWNIDWCPLDSDSHAQPGSASWSMIRTCFGAAQTWIFPVSLQIQWT